MLRVLQVDGCGLANSAGIAKREAGGQLLHRAAHHRMRLGLMTALQDGAESPAARSRAAAARSRAAAGRRSLRCIASGATSRMVPAETHQHPDDGGSMQSLAAGNERFDADHPEGRHGDEDRRQSARHPLLGDRPDSRCRVPMMMTPNSAVYQSSRPVGRCAFEK